MDIKCPENVIQRAKILYWNSFGFQGPQDGTNKDIFILARLSNNFDANLIDIIKKEINVMTIDLIDWLGYDFLTIHWTDYPRRFEVLTALLRHGQTFLLQIKDQIVFTPTDIYIDEAQIEKRLIEKYKEHEKIGIGFTRRLLYNMHKSYNWKSIKGQQFCRQYRLKLNKSENNLNSKHNFYNWPIFLNIDMNTLLDKENNMKIENIKEEVNLCLICEESEANTIVYPCQHNVVCQACSITLQSTNNAHLCILCRQPISKITIK